MDDLKGNEGIYLAWKQFKKYMEEIIPEHQEVMRHVDDFGRLIKY